MPTRSEILLDRVPRDGRIIEIGPSFNPIAPKSEGWNSVSIDFLTREGLVAKYSGYPGVDVSRIEPVDFVWTGGVLSDALPPEQHGSFDVLLASHVIEHTPDLIAFLDAAATLLKPDGVVILVIPDKRYCFDYFQPLTTTGQLLEAHAHHRSRHTARLAFDQTAYAVTDGGAMAWLQRPSQGTRFVRTLEDASHLFETFESDPNYADLHAWRFVPPSFELILLELARLGETDWRVERVTPAEGCGEFFAWLRRGGGASAGALSVEDVDAQRMMLLKRTILETQAQIGWLLAGEPELVATTPMPSAISPALAEQSDDVIAELRLRLVEAEAQCAAALQRVAALESSMSWRITAPLRALISKGGASNVSPSIWQKPIALATRRIGAQRNEPAPSYSTRAAEKLSAHSAQELGKFVNWLRAIPTARVLEIGTRRSDPEHATHHREWAAADADYIMSDFQDGLDVDVVADAHTLTTAFGRDSFDAVIGCSVFEHIQRPWIAAREIASILKPSGRVFIQTHQSFGIHGYPSDYWRFTKEALETIMEDAGLAGEAFYEFPCRLVSERLGLSGTGYLNVCIVAQKP